jgi:hypothetical protein
MTTHRGFDLSAFALNSATLELIQKRDALEARLRRYRAENAEFARVYFHDGLGQRVSHFVPALRRADADLLELEAQAIASGDTLPDREEFLSKTRARVAEYERLEPALSRALDQAESAVTAAITEELPELARQGFEQSNKARKDYAAAVAKAEAARERMRGSVGRFLWAVTAGEMHRPKWSGWGNLGDEVDTWRLTTDGQALTYESARDLGLVDQWRGLRAELDGFVAPPDETAV